MKILEPKRHGADPTTNTSKDKRASWKAKRSSVALRVPTFVIPERLLSRSTAPRISFLNIILTASQQPSPDHQDGGTPLIGCQPPPVYSAHSQLSCIWGNRLLHTQCEDTRYMSLRNTTKIFKHRVPVTSQLKVSLRLINPKFKDINKNIMMRNSDFWRSRKIRKTGKCS